MCGTAFFKPWHLLREETMKTLCLYTRIRTRLFLLILTCAMSTAVLGQTPALDIQTMKNMPFLELVDLRVSLTSEIAELQQVIKDLPKKIEDAEQKDRKLSQYSDQLKAINAKVAKTDEDKRNIVVVTGLINDLKDEIGDKNAESYKADLQVKQKELSGKITTIDNVKKVLASIYTPEQSFKLTMSITFAILIGMVILGFFLLSYIDPTVRQAIFASQTGIQFLTLFSLVIAIILFGITGILQDKELAALLGGLSGYILGRYSQSSERSAAPANDNAAHAPVVPPAQVQEA